MKTQLLCCLNNIIPPKNSHLKWNKTPHLWRASRKQSVKAGQASVRRARCSLKQGGIRDRFPESRWVQQGKGTGTQGCPTAFYFKRCAFFIVAMLELDVSLLKGTAFSCLLWLSITKEQAFNGSLLFFGFQTREKFWFPQNIYFTHRKMVVFSSWILFDPST